MDALALYGAITGTIGLGWNIRPGIRSERVDIQVTVVTEPVPYFPRSDTRR